jgi:hypothetical protein
VLVGAAADIRAAGDQRFDRLVAALEIVDLDVEPLALEKPALLRNR